MTEKATDPALLRLPPVPRYDAERDGNPFAWIVATAPQVREHQVDLVQTHRAQHQDREI
mgnify:CR=1 FL=1